MRNCKVYKISYLARVYERVSTCGGMDSELTGREYDEKYVTHVAAPNAKMVQTWWDTMFSPNGCNGKVLEITEVCEVQTVISVG